MTPCTLKWLLMFVLLTTAGFAATKPFAEIRKAAEQGNAAAQCELGFMYGTGDGVPKDSVEAVKWYRMAAEEGDAHILRSAAVAAPSRTLTPRRPQAFPKAAEL